MVEHYAKLDVTGFYKERGTRQQAAALAHGRLLAAPTSRADAASLVIGARHHRRQSIEPVRVLLVRFLDAFLFVMKPRQKDQTPTKVPPQTAATTPRPADRPSAPQGPATLSFEPPQA